MDRIVIPDRLDPSGYAGESEVKDHTAQGRKNRRKPAKQQGPGAPEASTDETGDSHQLDEHA